MRPHTTMAVGGSKIRCGVHSLSEKFRFSPYLVRYLCPGGEAGDSKQLAFRSSPSLGGDELDMPRLLACGGPPVTARTDEDTGEPAPARSLPHTQTRARGARQPPPHQALCFAPQVWGSSFRNFLPFKAAISAAVDDVPRAEYGAVRACALPAPASDGACSGRL